MLSMTPLTETHMMLLNTTFPVVPLMAQYLTMEEPWKFPKEMVQNQFLMEMFQEKVEI